MVLLLQAAFPFFGAEARPAATLSIQNTPRHDKVIMLIVDTLTVEELTGRKIDNYASVNLLGFYEITEAVGGVEVCLKQATSDKDSGADFAAGHQTISGGDALAFVRQRHGLPRGDLDRIVRQQAFMAGLAKKVLSTQTLTDPDKLNDLVAA
ncbi:MAG: LCP family protein, partial [Limnochordales bacterium]